MSQKSQVLGQNFIAIRATWGGSSLAILSTSPKLPVPNIYQFRRQQRCDIFAMSSFSAISMQINCTSSQEDAPLKIDTPNRML
jgi:hypothetical protein